MQPGLAKSMRFLTTTWPKRPNEFLFLFVSFPPSSSFEVVWEFTKREVGSSSMERPAQVAVLTVRGIKE
jgi:hypothetical protein